MNRLLLTLALVAVFVVASFFWENHVSDHTRELIDMVDRATQALDVDGDFEGCALLLGELDQQWQSVHDTWETMIAHEKLLEIETVLVQARRAVDEKDRTESTLLLEALRVSLQHLADSHALSLENLL